MATELIGHFVRFPQAKPRHCCDRCGQKIRRRDDYLRASFKGAHALMHWRCFLAEMRESNLPDHNRAATTAAIGARP